MKRLFLFLFAALAVRGAFAAHELLAVPRFGDPTTMQAFSRSNVFDVATVYFRDDRATNFTTIVWMKWTPRRGYFVNGMVPWVECHVSADPARSTLEGGDELPDLQSHSYEVPLALSGGTWAETCLPAYEYPATLWKWQYGCFAVNVETDAALTLNVAGAERSVPASPQKQVFNIMGATASRSVSVAAESTTATVRLGIAVNPLVQFVGVQFDDDGEHDGSWANGEYGGLQSNEWRMVVFRGRIAGGDMTVNMCGYNATRKFYCENSATRELWHPRATFAKNARIRIMCSNLQGGIGYGTDDPDIFHLYGLRIYRGWLGDAEVERMRDLDAAEMARRGM